MACTSTADTCLELHIGFGMHCEKAMVHKPSTQSRLSKIKPYMFRRVMLMTECYSQDEFCCREINHAARDSSEMSCNTKMMELFPQHKGFDNSSILAKAKANTLSEEDGMLVKDSVDVSHLQPPTEQSKSQLTIFYNGTVKVFDASADEAKVIMMMAASNNLQRPSTFDGGSFPSWDDLPLRGSLEKNSSSAAGSFIVPKQKSDAELPIAKKLSLQGFLQKRKDRMKRQAPYQTSAK